MADIAHVFPVDLTPSPKASFGVVRPDSTVVRYADGGAHSRSFTQHSRRTFAIPPKLIASSDSTLTEWETFWHQINGGADVGYILDPLSHHHRRVPCGPITDGSGVFFLTNIVGLTGETVFVDGLPIADTDYTLHDAATLIDSDEYGSPEAVADFAVANGTIALSRFTQFGAYSLKVTGGGVSPVSLLWIDSTSGRGNITMGQEDVSLLINIYDTKSGGRTINVGAVFKDVSDTSIDSDTDSITTTGGQWEVLTASFTGVANTTSAYLSFTDSGTNTEGFYIDAIAVTPADYDRLWLPSAAPAVIEFDSAPAANSRVYVNGTGQRITRCKFRSDTSWTYRENDSASINAVNAVEVLEY